MGAGTYTKIKTVITGETITASDRNAEHDNHITNQNFAGLDDYSATVAEMKVSVDPFASSTEVLATNGQGEIERLRYQIDRIGEALRGSDFTEWYHDMPTLGLLFLDNTNSQVKFTMDGTASPHFEIESDDSTTNLMIDNDATDGDPVLSFALGGTQVVTMGIDDGDSDKFKIGSTAIGTNTAVEIIPTAAPHVKIISDDATTELAIDNTATDGDPTLSFELSGTSTFNIGISDGDSDQLKFGTTALDTNPAIIIPTTGNAALFADGSATNASIAHQGDANTGLYFTALDNMDVTIAGTRKVNFAAGGVSILSGELFLPDGVVTGPSIRFTSDTDTGIYYGGTAGDVFITCAGAISARFRDGSTSFHVSGTERLALSGTDFVPVGDDEVGLGTTDNRWAEVFSAIGTINTSHSSAKTDIVDIPQVIIPQGKMFKRIRNGVVTDRNYIGYINDPLPVECRSMGKDGVYSETDNYENAVAGMLCAGYHEHDEKIKRLERQIERLTKADAPS